MASETSPRNTSDSDSSPNLTPDDKWPRGIIQLPATAKDINDYIRWKIDTIEEQDWKGSDLSEYYRVDFEDFKPDNFDQASQTLLRLLRDTLRRRGVYVSKGRRGHRLSIALVEAVDDELPWPEDNPQRPDTGRPQTPTLPNPPVVTQTAPTQQPTPVTGPTIRFQDRISDPTRQPSPFQPEETPTPIGPSQIAPRTDNYTREMANLAKLYTDEDRYSGQTIDSFEYKLTIFQSKCKKAGIPQSIQHRAFDEMLTGLAKEFYYQSCQGLVEYTLDQLCEAIRKRFKTSERRRANLHV
jgi:hypothetical protein